MSNLTNSKSQLLHQLREIPDLLNWVSCFGVYAAVLMSKHPGKRRQPFAYQTMIVWEAIRCGGNGWVHYDSFQQQVAGKVDADWSELNAFLYAVTFLAQSSRGTKLHLLYGVGSHTAGLVQCHANAPGRQIQLSGQDTSRWILRQQMAVSTTCLVHAALIGTTENVVTPNAGTDTHAYTVQETTQSCSAVSYMSTMESKGRRRSFVLILIVNTCPVPSGRYPARLRHWFQLPTPLFPLAPVCRIIYDIHISSSRTN